MGGNEKNPIFLWHSLKRKILIFLVWFWFASQMPSVSGRYNLSILKEINPEYTLEGLMLKLKLQYFGHLMLRTGSLEKTLMLGKIEGRRRMGRQRMKWLDTISDQWTWIWANSGRQWRTEEPGVLQSMGSQKVRHDLAAKQQKQNIWDLMWEEGKRKIWVWKRSLLAVKIEWKEALTWDYSGEKIGKGQQRASRSCFLET